MDGQKPLLRAGFLATVAVMYLAAIGGWCWYLDRIGETWDGIAISAIASPAIIGIMFHWVLTRLRGKMPEREQAALAHPENSLACRAFALILPEKTAADLTRRLVLFAHPLSWIVFIIALIGVAAVAGGATRDRTILVFIPWAGIWCLPLDGLLFAEASPATVFIGRILLSGIVFATLAAFA